MTLLIILALLFTTANSAGLITGIFSRPPNTVYLGTIHYFEDYFLYINHFFQGAHGAYLTANRYTIETTSPTILYWTDLFTGKIGNIMSLSPITSYHISLFVLTILTIIAIYLLFMCIFPKSKIQTFIGFLFALTSTSFMNHIYVDKRPMWYPFQLWKTPHFALDRFGGVPHQTLQYLLFLLLTILCFSQNVLYSKVKLIIIGILAFSLISINPIQGIIFLVAFLATQGLVYIQKKPIPYSKILVLIFASICTFIYVYHLSTTLPHSIARSWDGLQQTTTTFPFLLYSLGPISILVLLGIIPSYRSGNKFLIFSIILTLGTYALFFSTIPRIIGVSNLRIIFPALYPFIGAIAVEGVLFIANKISKSIPIKTTITVITISFIILSLPTLYWEIDQKIHNQKDTTNQMIYLSTPIYSLFMKLKNIGSFNDITVANPNSHMDTLTPALSGHTSFSGHMLLTIDSDKKRSEAIRFFSLSMPNALQWLRSYNIRYVLFTELDGNINDFSRTYPYLDPVYEYHGNGIYKIP